jgi:two-component system NtrC family sensor kinase
LEFLTSAMKLGTKLILPLVLTTIAIMVVHGYFSIEQEGENSVREIRVGMRGFTRAIQGALIGLYGDDHDLASTQEFIDKVGPRGNIHGVIVYNVRGDQVAVSSSLSDAEEFPDLDPRLVLQLDPRPVLERGAGVDGYLGTPKRLIYYHLEPIFDSEGKLAGAFAIARQGWVIRRAIETRRYRIIGTTSILIVLFCALILFIVRRNLSRPIRKLVERIREIGEGRWDQRIEAAGGDEVSTLAQEFNRMCERLQESYTRLIEEQREKFELGKNLRHSERLASVGQLAAGLAHEIGTPLNIIAGRAEHLLRRRRSPIEMNENLQIIRSQIDRIAGIVRQLLQFSRRREPALRTVDITSLLTNIKRLCEHKTEEKGTEVELVLPPSLPKIKADPDLLQQVFINLYLNSLHAIGEGGRIQIRAQVVQNGASGLSAQNGERWLKILFEDNGPGIAAEDIEHVFDPFFTTKDVGEGTGLGLSVSYGIVKEHGGEISVESEPGSWTRFVILLPILPPSGNRLGENRAT